MFRNPFLCFVQVPVIFVIAMGMCLISILLPDGKLYNCNTDFEIPFSIFSICLIEINSNKIMMFFRIY